MEVDVGRWLDAANEAHDRFAKGVDAASLGLKKVKKVTLVPEIFHAGVDYAVEVGGPTATLRITTPDKFKQNRFIIVVE